MNKPYGRKTKKKVRKILSEPNKGAALKQLAKIPDEQLVGHLFSHFYHRDELVKFRSTTAMGYLTARTAKKSLEKARIILRRIMWNLNDESGGIGWGSPEAMGESLCQSPEIALEFKSILFSYLDPEGNFIEHGMLQRGVIWGIGTYLESSPKDLTEITKNLLYGHLHSSDAIKRGYAIRALFNANCFDCSQVPENIITDGQYIDIYNGWHFIKTRISDIALACDHDKIFV